MKSRFACSVFAALAFFGAFAQTVDKDLPKNSYTQEFPIPAGTLKAGDNELVIRNDCAEICVCYVIIR